MPPSNFAKNWGICRILETPGKKYEASCRRSKCGCPYGRESVGFAAFSRPCCGCSRLSQLVDCHHTPCTCIAVSFLFFAPNSSRLDFQNQWLYLSSKNHQINGIFGLLLHFIPWT